MESRSYFVYILTNRSKTLYIGVTNDLARRLLEHRQGVHECFTKKYRINRLVYYECGDEIYGALCREKQLKNWHRQWKVNLIESVNPEWNDLSGEILENQVENSDPETSSG